MDVALFAPYIGGCFSLKSNIFEWLGIVHGMFVESMIEQVSILCNHGCQIFVFLNEKYNEWDNFFIWL